MPDLLPAIVNKLLLPLAEAVPPWLCTPIPTVHVPTLKLGVGRGRLELKLGCCLLLLAVRVAVN